MSNYGRMSLEVQISRTYELMGVALRVGRGQAALSELEAAITAAQGRVSPSALVIPKRYVRTMKKRKTP